MKDRLFAAYKINRRDLLRLGGLGLGALLLAGKEAAPAEARPVVRKQQAPAAVTVTRRLAATDGHILLPGRVEPLYVFGFVEVPVTATVPEVTSLYKGQVKVPAPILAVDEEDDFYLTLTNIGLVVRPDLDDSHTVHWHGFRNPIAIFDGVPEASIAVPVGRNFPYFYKPHNPGTYMYHCHFEDVEHVQMGMTGIVFVRPSQNTGPGPLPAGNYAYNDGDGTTAYDREFALLLNEIDTRPHDNLEGVQEFIWSDYKPNYWIINGRSYPHTILPNDDASLPSQPLSSLIQVNPGEAVLLRFANLGYQQHAMQLPGIPMHVVGEDATLLRGPDGADISYWTNTIYIGPGEARDVLFTAPAFDPTRAVSVDAVGAHNVYLLKNRNYNRQINGAVPGLGGMITQVRVYQGGVVPAQAVPNQTYL
jgi:FtsP/CotA-like multicopper oxidase with cupredoxin domain